MNDAITDKEARLIDTPGGMARVLWYRYWRALRLGLRAWEAQTDYEIMWGTGDRTKIPTGILNA